MASDFVSITSIHPEPSFRIKRSTRKSTPSFWWGRICFASDSGIGAFQLPWVGDLVGDLVAGICVDVSKGECVINDEVAVFDTVSVRDPSRENENLREPLSSTVLQRRKLS